MKRFLLLFFMCVQTLCVFAKENLQNPLSESELKQVLLNQTVYGYSHRSKKPYTVEFKENNVLLMHIGSENFIGQYEIIDLNGIGMIREIYSKEQPHYISDNPQSLYSPKNPNHISFISGALPLGPFYYIDTGNSPKKTLVHQVPNNPPCYSYEIMYTSE